MAEGQRSEQGEELDIYSEEIQLSNIVVDNSDAALFFFFFFFGGVVCVCVFLIC